VKLFVHYCPHGFSNCYIAGTDPDAASREAVIIDPGIMDKGILDRIEQHNYRLMGVLVTHDHQNHVHGLRTLKRIYDVEIYAVNHIIQEHKTNRVKDGDSFTIGSFPVEVISVPGHSSDSAVFKINHLLFTGDALNAGMLGTTASSYGAEVQLTALRTKLFSLPGNYVVLPGHGPPSTLDTERRFNAGIQMLDQHKNKPRSFTMETWGD
jgi:glyoxylase-like metal-dependent hydrolase (beta-lactamase superfamily II)